MKKLLMYFSYIGTNYRGLQKQVGEYNSNLQTIQGILEYALTKVLEPGEDVRLFMSSRTDIGVHSCETTAHFVIDENAIEGVYSPEKLCQRLNYLLETVETDVRVKRIVEVPEDFHVRRADSRTYCYRVAVSKSNDFFSSSIAFTPRAGNLPISEVYRCQVVAQPFDVEKVQDACKLFLGPWNFRSFMMPSKETKDLEIDDVKFLKTLYKISFSRASRPEINNYFDRHYDKFDFYELNIESSGFLRRQVRRMMGTLISIGHGNITQDDILFLLRNPHEKNWNQRIRTAQPDGLYLKSVNYKGIENRILRGPYS